MVNNSYPLYSKTILAALHTSTCAISLSSAHRMLKEYASPNPKGWLHTSQHLYSIILQQMEYSPSSRLMWVFFLRVTRLFVLSTPGWVPSASSSTTVSATERTDGLAPHSKKNPAFYPPKNVVRSRHQELSDLFPWTRLVPVVACHGTRHCDLQGTKAVDGATSWENHRTNVGKTMENKPHPWLGMVVTYHLRKWWWLGIGLWHCFTHSRWSTRFSTWMSCLFIQKSRDQEVLAYGRRCGHPKSVVSTRKIMEKPRVLGSTLFSGQPNILNEFVSPCLVVSTSTPQCFRQQSDCWHLWYPALPASDRVTLGLSPQTKDPNWSCPGRCLQWFEWSSISVGYSLVFRSKQVVNGYASPRVLSIQLLHTKLGCLLATKPLSQRDVTEQWTPSKPVDLSRQVQLSPQSIKIYAPF